MPSLAPIDHSKKTFNVFDEVIEEVRKVDDIHPSYNSAHEALGVIREEYMEFEQIVFLKQKERDLSKMRKELIQLACTAIRAARDICDEERGRK